MFKTAESVCMGHPDKLCDYIADSILDCCLLYDQNARVACEVLATNGKIILAGEISTTEEVNVLDVVDVALWESGYNPDEFEVYNLINKQSADIASAVSQSLEVRQGDNTSYNLLGAGDQGTVYGYATNETNSCLPLALDLAHKLCKRLDTLRIDGVIEGIHSDGKAQVTLEYDGERLLHVHTVLLSVQHDEDKDSQQLRGELISEVILPIFEHYPIDEETIILINPSGRFVTGGPTADTGLTGRKIMVDTYGGLAAHGGGAFTGKDPSKVDRSAAYMARYIAKNYVKAEICSECSVSLSYAIGKAKPVMVQVTSHGTSEYSDEVLTDFTQRYFNLKPAAIIEFLDLRKPKYRRTARYGHFSSFIYLWERTFDAFKIKEALEEYAD